MSYPTQPPSHHTTLVVMNNKSTLTAYILWLFLGSLGVHRFYLGSLFLGIFQLVIGAIGWATTFLFVGWFILGILYIWLIFDLFWIPMRTGKLQNRNMEKMMSGLSK